MTIAELLKLHNSGVRLSCGDVWMFYDEFLNQWTVLQHLYRKRVPITVIETESETKAVAAFCEAAKIEAQD